jgi:2-keto-4-pentenoate hydratase/2-oxohepta-3-ene-1,7-dioic acid hydratase in catechol pathway
LKLLRWAGPDGPVTGYLVDDDHAVPIADTVLAAATRATREPGALAPAAGDPVALAGRPLLPPVDPPGALRDFYAFERHVATARARRGLAMEEAWYRLPVFYFSNPAALIGAGAVVAPPPRSVQLDFELELAWLVGEDVAGNDVAAAARAIVGFTVMNDWSARDIQREEMALSLGPAKGKDFATSLGPVLVTADEFDPAAGGMRAWVNNRQYTDADLAECYWSPAEMTAYAAEATVVRAGDVFGSGTCGGGCILELALSHGEAAYPWLQAGDIVELEIDGLGRLKNAVGVADGKPWTERRQRDR